MDLVSYSPVIVIGMHRSGTTLVAQLLEDLGVSMGSDLEYYHESIFFQRLNQSLLESYGADWTRPEPFLEAMEDPSAVEACAGLVRTAMGADTDQRAARPAGEHWGWKDPRNTLTLPVWLRCFPQSTVIDVVRDGVEVALSLHRREMRRLLRKRGDSTLLPPTIGRAYRLWRTYRTAAARALADVHPPPGRIRYEALLDDPVVELSRLSSLAGLSIPPDRAREVASQRIRPRRPRSLLTSARLRLLSLLGVVDFERSELGTTVRD